ncbi:MAG: DNA polymerase III subunit delta [Alphaproteobacteria bacterium]|nr:DNA polymerase III subunit delta [Alphaproteobacteria bacterium]
MKLATSQINAFLKSPDPAVRVILFYGPDAGLVRERADQMAIKTVEDQNDPFRIALLTGNSLSESSTRLYEEMAAQALGGGKRLVRIQHAIESNASALGKLVADMPLGDSLLIIEAGDLDKRSKMRAICESNDQKVCAIPCYVEDAAARQRTIGDILQSCGLEASRETIALLNSILPPDRIAMRSELEKLAMYAHGQTSVTVDDVNAVLNNASSAEMDNLIMLIAGGDAGKAIATLDHLLAEQIAPVSILRAAQRHFIRLQLARSSLDSGSSAEEAIKKLQPPVFWKSVAPMTQQVRKWRADKIEKVLQRLFEAEAAVKSTGTPAFTLCSQLMLQISSMR